MNDLSGILIIDKPQGWTSHDVVAKARGLLKTRKIGHAGTLDPLATGVLVLLVGRCTKLSDQFMGFDKTYSATLQLGLKTTSADIEGEIIGEKSWEAIDGKQLHEVFQRFEGEIEQLPPMYSAVKHKGRPLYKLARRGIEVQRTPRQVCINELIITKIDKPHVQFDMICSKGTYVRQLANDIGDVLGCGACITQIRRTKIGPFVLEDSISIEEINENHLRQWQHTAHL